MTGSGANNRDVKKINRIRTIRSIFSCDRISQPELAAKVNNSWPTVLQNVKELMAMGLVQEVGTFESTGGRKARAFAPVRDARLAVGLEITQNHVRAVLVDLSGNLLRHERKKRLQVLLLSLYRNKICKTILTHPCFHDALYSKSC